MNQQLLASATIKKIITLAKNNPDVEILWLYGSRARDCADKKSDYDLAIAFKSYLQDPVERRLRPELLALDWHYQLKITLSIVDFNQAALPLAYTVLQDNVVLYNENNYRKMTEEQTLMSKWELDYHYHTKYYA